MAVDPYDLIALDEAQDLTETCPHCFAPPKQPCTRGRTLLVAPHRLRLTAYLAEHKAIDDAVGSAG